MEIYLSNLKNGIREDEIASIFSDLDRQISVKIIQTTDSNSYAIIEVPRKRKSLLKSFKNAFKV